VADERQDVSFKNTIDEMTDAISVGNDIGLWSATIPEEMQKYWLKDETGSPHQNHNGEVVDRS